MVAAGNRQNTESILRVLRQCASALDAAHKQGIVHRDIKPGNILIDESGHVKITDFGIARITSAGATETMSSGMGFTVGTLGYMAPEQIRGEAVDGKADQFSLGIVAYQLFTGVMPFEADTWIALSYKIIHDEPPVLVGKHPAVNAAMEIALKRSISKKPADRFESCTAFADALSTPVVAKEPRNWILVGAALAVVAAGLAWMYLMPKAASTPEVKPQAQAEMAYTPAPPAPAAPAPATTAIVEQPKTETIEFVRIPAGQFFMGSDTDTEDQRPKHMVRLTKPFEMAKTETTEKQWSEVMGGAAGSDLPKVNVSWREAQSFIGKLNQRGDGYTYRLPTEAEWEYAARGGGEQERPRNLDDVAWNSNNSGRTRQKAGTLAANGYGLHDMLGNVFEWTGDWLEEGYYANSPAANPQGGATGTMRLNRGGCFETQAMLISTAYRFADPPETRLPTLGFRAVREKR